MLFRSDICRCGALILHLNYQSRLKDQTCGPPVPQLWEESQGGAAPSLHPHPTVQSRGLPPSPGDSQPKSSTVIAPL